MRTIPCTCDPEGRLERRALNDLAPYQRDLKSLSIERYAHLKQSLEELGFTAPVLVWQAPDGECKVLDGHQRLRVLQEEEWTVEGGIPVVQVSAATEGEAARKLLAIASQYGHIEPQGLYEFGHHYALDLPALELSALPALNWPAFLAEFYDGDGFQPRLDPTLSSREVTDAEVAAAQERQGDHLTKEQRLTSHTCPFCGKEFFEDD